MSIIKLYEFSKLKRGAKSKTYLTSWRSDKQKSRWWRSGGVIIEKGMKLDIREMYYQFTPYNLIFMCGPYNRIYTCSALKLMMLHEYVNETQYTFDKAFNAYKKARYRNKKLTLYKYILGLETLVEL